MSCASEVIRGLSEKNANYCSHEQSAQTSAGSHQGQEIASGEAERLCARPLNVRDASKEHNTLTKPAELGDQGWREADRSGGPHNVQGRSWDSPMFPESGKDITRHEASIELDMRMI